MDKQKFNELWNKYKDVIPYVFWGVMTTLVNIASYWLCNSVFKWAIMPSTIIAQFLSIIFAYLTNRKWVFHSQASTFEEYVHEIVSFFAARIGTALLDMAIMFIFAEQMHLNSMIIKILANVVVVVVNYVASKFWIFKSKDDKQQ
ncbi:GtrA family protein [uncultured Lactobacillus sp.]|uniref:GtrA family protein n=1 Tax=uncultured Lactobacillus sp. TaxID=153152 RepID=UPI002665A707|nr:GtrA family protein [uncultured Lactobacillus sp.]